MKKFRFVPRVFKITSTIDESIFVSTLLQIYDVFLVLKLNAPVVLSHSVVLSHFVVLSHSVVLAHYEEKVHSGNLFVDRPTAIFDQKVK